jgi:hypothetical protein
MGNRPVNPSLAIEGLKRSVTGSGRFGRRRGVGCQFVSFVGSVG